MPRIIVFFIPLFLFLQGCMNFLGLPINETFAGGHEKRLFKMEKDAKSDMFSSPIKCVEAATYAVSIDNKFTSTVTLLSGQKRGWLSAIRLIEKYCIPRFPEGKLLLLSTERDLLARGFQKTGWDPELASSSLKKSDLPTLIEGDEMRVLDLLELLNNQVIEELRKNPNDTEEKRTLEYERKIVKFRCGQNNDRIAFYTRRGAPIESGRLQTQKECNSRFAREKEEICALCLSSLLSRFSQ